MEEFAGGKRFLEEDIDTNLDTLRARGYSSEALEVLDNYLTNAYGADISAAILVGSAGGYNLSHLADSSYIRYMENGDKHDQRATDSDLIVVLDESTVTADVPDVTKLQELFYQEEGEEWSAEELDEFIEYALPKPDRREDLPHSLQGILFGAYDSESDYWTEDEKEALRERMVATRGEMNDNLVDGPINMLYPELEINPRFQYRGTFRKKLQGALKELEKPPAEREAVIFPATDGKGIDKTPSEFLGTFMKGFTALVEDEDVESWIEDIREIAPQKDQELEESIWDKLESRMEFKQRSMNMNYRLGLLERTLEESEYLEGYLEEEMLEEDEEDIIEDKLETEIGQYLNEFVKTVLAGENSDSGLTIEPFTTDVATAEEARQILHNREDAYDDPDQQTLDVGVEQETEAGREQARRRAREIIDDHPDLELVRQGEMGENGMAEPGSWMVKAGKVSLE
ncbi:MAG: hypothetical protein ABEI58_02755, partial [Candidatus Nanohaloarchaea archaeon]